MTSHPISFYICIITTFLEHRMLVLYGIIIIIASITLTIDIVTIGIGPSPCRSLGRYII